MGHIAGSGLGDEAGSLSPGAAAVRLVLVLRQPGQQEAVRQEALPRQHNAATQTHVSWTAQTHTGSRGTLTCDPGLRTATCLACVHIVVKVRFK